MAFDPQREDYTRLGVRFASTLDFSNAAEATRAFATFGRRFAQDRDSLPQSDGDRAFHLVVLASRNIDLELPFADEARAKELIEESHRILDEAIQLDPHCYDALRMKTAATSNSFDAFLTFLDQNAQEVRSYCEEQRAAAKQEESDERRCLLADLAMRPYLRWVATQAEEALICGRNREAIRLCNVAMELDPRDTADVRFTASLAYAKLEDEAGLMRHLSESSKSAMRPCDDAWSQLAILAIAFKQRNEERALDCIHNLIPRYPHAAEALIRQNELPDGVFARLAVTPYSEDELIIALSEATVLLQEGVDFQGRGILSSWVIEKTAQISPQAMIAVMAQQMPDEPKNDGGRQ